MAVGTNRTRRLTIDNIVLAAYRLAGLINEHGATNTAKRDVAYTLLESIVDENQIYGLYAREIVFETILLTADVTEYALSENTFDVIGDAMYIPASAADITRAEGETVIQQIDRDGWQKLSSKAAESSVPSLFYCDRTNDANVKVVLWPVPTEAGHVRLQSHRLAADNFEGGRTPDLERFWNQFLIWELAHQLAVSNSMDPMRINHLSTTASAKLLMARSYANPRGSQQATIDHPTPWSR